MYSGPNIERDGLVFGMDTGYGIANKSIATRHYKGKPTENLLTIAGSDAEIERSGTSYPYYSVNINSVVQSRWSVSNNQLTISFEGKRDNVGGGTGGGNDGYPVFYVYFTDWSWASTKSITSYDWTLGTSTFTMPNPSGKTVYFSIYHMNSGNRGRSYSRKHSLEFNSIKTPFVNGTRSSTQSLIDLTKTTNIDVSNVSFDSTGQPTFDGTNDYIDLPTSVFPAMGQITIELVNFGIDARNSSVIAGGVGGNQDLNIHLPWGDGNIYWDVGRPFNRVYKAAGSDYIGWHHWVFTKNSSTGIMNIYRDGVLWAQNTGQTSDIISLSGGVASIGRYSNGSTNAYYHNGTVPVLKIYDVELTSLQARHNFNAYKTRFGIV